MPTLTPNSRSLTVADPELSDDTQFYVAARAVSAYEAPSRVTPVIRPANQPDSGPIGKTDERSKVLSHLALVTGLLKAVRFHWQTDAITVHVASTWNDLDFGRQNVLLGLGADLSNSPYRTAFGTLLAHCVHEVIKRPDSQCQTSRPAVQYPKVIGAPQWLKDQRAVLRQMPPPTLEEVRTQFKASAEVRKKLDAKQHS